MYRLLLAILISAFSILRTFGASEASGLLDDIAGAMHQAGGISASFTMTVDGHKSAGELVISGDKFKLATAQITIWYDGKTQWTYNSDIREVNITEPTPGELSEINPFVIISSFRKNFNAQLLKSATGLKKIDLTPLKEGQSAVKRAIITVNASSLMPTEIAMTLDDGQTIAIHITSLTKGKNYPHSTFVFNKKSYPKAEIVDLR